MIMKLAASGLAAAAAVAAVAVPGARAYVDQSCTVATDCEGYKGCTFPENQGACKCKNNNCRRKRVDCKEASWACAAGQTCLREAGAPKWGTCVTPLEEHLGLPFMTSEEVAETFDESPGTWVSNYGLVVYEVEGPSSYIDQISSLLLPFESYEEFQRYCVTKCQRNDQCGAVSTNKEGLYTFLSAVELGLHKRYLCTLYDTDVEVRGVRAAQRTNSSFASDTLFAKKGHDIQEFTPCKVDPLNFDLSYYCLGCLGDEPPDECELLDCSLLFVPDNADFLVEMAPAAVCLGNRTEACLGCTTEVLETLPSSFTIAGTICTAEDELNMVRGLCREECFEGIQHCEGDIQRASLCASGSPVIRSVNSTMGGAINTPYECPVV